MLSSTHSRDDDNDNDNNNDNDSDNDNDNDSDIDSDNDSDRDSDSDSDRDHANENGDSDGTGDGGAVLRTFASLDEILGALQRHVSTPFGEEQGGFAAAAEGGMVDGADGSGLRDDNRTTAAAAGAGAAMERWRIRLRDDPLVGGGGNDSGVARLVGGLAKLCEAEGDSSSLPSRSPAANPRSARRRRGRPSAAPSPPPLAETARVYELDLSLRNCSLRAGEYQLLSTLFAPRPTPLALRLRSLALTNHRPAAQGVRAVSLAVRFEVCPYLTRLDLTDNDLGGRTGGGEGRLEMMEALVEGLKGHASLKELVLADNRLGDAGVEMLLPLLERGGDAGDTGADGRGEEGRKKKGSEGSGNHMVGKRSGGLAEMNVGDHDGDNEAPGSCFPLMLTNLRALNLSGNGIADGGARTLARAIRRSQTDDARAGGGTNIGDATVASATSTTPTRTSELKRLLLRKNPGITDGGALSLMRSVFNVSSLRTVAVCSNHYIEEIDLSCDDGQGESGSDCISPQVRRSLDGLLYLNREGRNRARALKLKSCLEADAAGFVRTSPPFGRYLCHFLEFLGRECGLDSLFAAVRGGGGGTAGGVCGELMAAEWTAPGAAGAPGANEKKKAANIEDEVKDEAGMKARKTTKGETNKDAEEREKEVVIEARHRVGAEGRRKGTSRIDCGASGAKRKQVAGDNASLRRVTRSSVARA